jgi:beta-lactamase superfamily II metal-dependent hydrolase
MDGQLLVRVYNVGLGDCIFLRVPDVQRNVHILIDCGNKFGSLDLLEQRIKELKQEFLDDAVGAQPLDLLVVTHPHEDHNKGFEEAFFQDIKIERIWLSPAFDRLNPNAKGFHALNDAALRALQSLSLAASGEVKELVDELLSLSKSEALRMLNTTLPEKNGIQPLYVTAATPQEQLSIFEDPAIQLKVLGPTADIDGYYLGGEGQLAAQSALDSQGLADGYASLFPDRASVEVAQPGNISSQDFKQLRSRLGVNALAAAEISGHVTNNLSVVLLLEWHGRRLLFPGDAEWSGSYGGAVMKGRRNGSWNVMWQERPADLAAPLDFLKIGHHGSENATPWAPPDETTGKEHPINQILDALLPRPAPGEHATARAVASTQRTRRWPTIPDPALLVEIGKRVANAETGYVEDPSRKPHVPDGALQPQRTDLAAQLTGTPEKPVAYIEVRFSK